MVDLDAVRTLLGAAGADPEPALVADAMRELGYVVSHESVLETVTVLRHESRGAGQLDALLAEPGVTDVLVNGSEAVYVDRGVGLEKVSFRFESDEEVRRLAVRLAARVGRRLDDGQPFVDARLPDGTRVHAVLGGVAAPGTCLSLRVPARQRLTLADWEFNGSLHPAAGEILRRLVALRRALLITGGTGSGKTTLLGSLLTEVEPSERLVVVEDSIELNPDHPHCVLLEARRPNAEGVGEVSLTDLVRQALRMRPDRLVVGEVRGAELVDLLIALNTGHEGGCGTIHANSAAAVPARLEALGALAGLGRSAVHALSSAALDVVLHVVRGREGRRRLAEIAVLLPSEQGLVRCVPAVTVDAEGVLIRGAGADRLEELLK